MSTICFIRSQGTHNYDYVQQIANTGSKKRKYMLTKNQSPPFKTIMLVDDNQTDNMIHRRILTKANVAENIADFLFAEDALNYLKTSEGRNTDLIFLDINMPQMNGFEFLDELGKLNNNPKKLPIIVMLSTLNPNWDNDVSNKYPLIKHFFTKPLTEKFVFEIIESIA